MNILWSQANDIMTNLNQFFKKEIKIMGKSMDKGKKDAKKKPAKSVKEKKEAKKLKKASKAGL